MTDKKMILKRKKYVQYALIGAALGLYYGIFYKPGGDPDFGIAVVLSVFAAILTTIVRSWKKAFPIKKIIVDFVKMFAFFLIFLLSIVLRKIAYDLGGNVAVVVETTLFGVILGVLMAWQRFFEVKE